MIAQFLFNEWAARMKAMGKKFMGTMFPMTYLFVTPEDRKSVV